MASGSCEGIIRDNKAIFTDEKFDALLRGLFEFLESPLAPAGARRKCKM